jgi:ABC-type glycerol-3-phosphate transport system permease component
LVDLGVVLLPRGLTLFNYHEVFALKGILHSVLVSTARTLIGTLATVFSCSLLGYLFTKREMPARSFLYRTLVITMYVSGGLIPYFLMCRAYGLVNNFLVYILPSMVSAYNVILIKTFIEQLPASIEESAMLDGASTFTLFARIIFPLSMPIVATIAVFSAVGQWNSWFDNYIFNGTNDKLKTLQLLLYNVLSEASRLATMLRDRSSSISGIEELQKQMAITPTGVKMTITMLVTLPILAVYPFMQRFFVKGIMLGAVKG